MNFYALIFLSLISTSLFANECGTKASEDLYYSTRDYYRLKYSDDKSSEEFEEEVDELITYVQSLYFTSNCSYLKDRQIELIEKLNEI